MLRLVPSAALPLALLMGLLGIFVAGCPPTEGGDDDDTTEVEDTGEAPVLTDVTVCWKGDDPGCAGKIVQWRITVTDEDDDLNNPWVFILFENRNPLEARLETDVASGSTVRLDVCGEWAEGEEVLDFELWMLDAAENESNRWEDTWAVEEDDECPID